MSEAKVTVEMAGALVPVVAMLERMLEEVRGLPDGRGVEWTVHERLKAIDRASMEVCVQEKAREAAERDIREVRCPHCEDEWAVLLDPRAPRRIVTVRGAIRYERAIYRCARRDCQRQRSPFDEELGLEGKERFTPLVQDKIAWAGALFGSFEKARADMEHQVELPVSASAIHRITAKAAQRALALQEREVRERGAPASLEHPIPVGQRPQTLVLEMDGTCAMGRDGEGHEVKCGTVFGLDARAKTGSPGKERPILLNRSYCATSKGIEAFAPMLWALASWWGVRSAPRVVVLGDGIEWIWNWVRDRLPRVLADGSQAIVIEIIDFYHAAENLFKAATAIYADPKSPPAVQWYETWKDRLRQGQIEPLLEELEKRRKAARTETRRDELRLRAAYFRNHQHRMRYAQFEAMDLPIGSGAIEGTCKNLVKGRLDGVGMRWGVQIGIEQMVALRVRWFNGRWNDLWPHGQFLDAQAA